MPVTLCIVFLSVALLIGLVFRELNNFERIARRKEIQARYLKRKYEEERGW